MANLTNIEKFKLEGIFDMGSGYVLDFSNRSFQEFVFTSVSIDIYDNKYEYASGSKANRLRSFWQDESNYLVSKLNFDLLEYWKNQKLSRYQEIAQDEQNLYDECLSICEQLKLDSEIEHIEVIQPYSNDRDISLLTKSIRESLEKNEPEIALDRLHTYLNKYSRSLCDKHSIPYQRNTPLHSLFNGYVRYLRENHKVESKMTIEILGAATKILDAFNGVRNNQSLAHDNPILNHAESVLISNNIINLIKFVQYVEKKDLNIEPENLSDTDWDEIPF